MPVSIALRFPAGRYHATPWGRHVNEGVAEWPPSPWRLLRALVAVWKRTCPELPDERVKAVLEKLATPPQFALPPTTVAHTRHYLHVNDPNPDKRVLVFDTFVNVARTATVSIVWPAATLDNDEEVCLRRLVGNLTSLGRAESWVEAELLPSDTKTPAINCEPTENAANPLPLLCADRDTAFGDEHYPAHDKKKLAKGDVKLEDFLFDCPRWHLCLDTETLHKNRWPSAPGSVWVNYARPEERQLVAATPLRKAKVMPTVARFLLDGPVLPLLTDTLNVAERFRRKLLSHFKHLKNAKLVAAGSPELERHPTEVLSGKDAEGRPVAHHRHAFYLPTADGENDPRHLTHLTVVAEMGFDGDVVTALNAIRQFDLGDRTDSPKVRVQLVGLGQPGDFNHWLFKPSAVWETVTPFVAHRHLKRRGTKRDAVAGGPDFLALTAVECLERTHPGVEATVTVRPPMEGQPKSYEFRRRRARPGRADASRAFGDLRVTFAEPVARPQAFGYASHFGLGLLKPAEGGGRDAR